MRSGRYASTKRRTTSAKAVSSAVGVLKTVACSVGMVRLHQFATTSRMSVRAGEDMIVNLRLP
jgi:hypothetical protein